MLHKPHEIWYHVLIYETSCLPPSQGLSSDKHFMASFLLSPLDQYVHVPKYNPLKYIPTMNPFQRPTQPQFLKCSFHILGKASHVMCDN